MGVEVIEGVEWLRGVIDVIELVIQVHLTPPPEKKTLEAPKPKSQHPRMRTGNFLAHAWPLPTYHGGVSQYKRGTARPRI